MKTIATVITIVGVAMSLTALEEPARRSIEGSVALWNSTQSSSERMEIVRSLPVAERCDLGRALCEQLPHDEGVGYAGLSVCYPVYDSLLQDTGGNATLVRLASEVRRREPALWVFFSLQWLEGYCQRVRDETGEPVSAQDLRLVVRAVRDLVEAQDCSSELKYICVRSITDGDFWLSYEREDVDALSGMVRILQSQELPLRHRKRCEALASRIDSGRTEWEEWQRKQGTETSQDSPNAVELAAKADVVLVGATAERPANGEWRPPGESIRTVCSITVRSELTGSLPIDRMCFQACPRENELRTSSPKPHTATEAWSRAKTLRSLGS